MRFPSAETEGDSKVVEPTPIVRRVPSFVSIITSMVLLPVRTTTATCRLSGNQLGAVNTPPPVWSSRGEPEGYGTIITGPMLSTARFEPAGEKPSPPFVGPCHNSFVSPPFRDPTHNLRPRS